MGYRHENATDKPTLPVGCIFDGAMGWHNNYRIVDLAIEYGMDKDADLGWDESDVKIMAAYEASETEVVLNDAEALDQHGINDVADHWRERAEEYLDQFCPPFHHLEWDDGLYVRADEVEEADAHQSAVWHVNDIIVPMFAAEPDLDQPLHLGYVYTALAERFAALAKGDRNG